MEHLRIPVEFLEHFSCSKYFPNHFYHKNHVQGYIIHLIVSSTATKITTEPKYHTKVTVQVS